MNKLFLILIALSLLVVGCTRQDDTAVVIQNADPKNDHAIRPTLGSQDPIVRDVFNQIVSIVLTSPALKHSREFYGTVDDTRCALVNNDHYGISWPDWYIPELDGFEFVRATEGNEVEPTTRRLLGIRIDKFDLNRADGDGNALKLFDGPIEVTLLNAGGDPGGAIVNGGARVYFRINWENGKPVISFAGLMDL